MTTGSAISYQMYYHILGLQPGATLQDIKQAYRDKAKMYHPDLNKSPGAKEKFIEVNEAYEFLVRLKSGGIPGRRPHGRESGSDELFKQWMQRERQKARARAAREARKKYEDFKKSRIFKTSRIVSAAYDYIFIVIGLIIIIVAINGIFLTPDINNPYNPDAKITFPSILAALVICGIGIIFIIFAGINIKSRRLDKKK